MKKIGKKNIAGSICIPSGIRCTKAEAIERYFGFEGIGIITTKSVSFKPKTGYKEPLYVRVGEQSYINAVGLENPGAEVFAQELAGIAVPEDKFLLVSVFGKDADEFYSAASVLAKYADGFELNLSCPHAKGYGLQIGSDPDLVVEITKRISESFDIPVFVKLSAAVQDIAGSAKAAAESGASGAVLINTVPGMEYVGGVPILSNVTGGMSGSSIRPVALKAVREVRQAIGNEPVIIGMGGISSAAHIESFKAAGADFFGIGSALTGLNTSQAEEYIGNLHKGADIPNPADSITNMDYQECEIESNISLTDTLHRIKLSPWKNYPENTDVAGKFFFICIPGTGEKPFALYSYENREFIIKNVGCFTGVLTGLKPGNKVYIRGPYGNGMPDFEGAEVNFVAGGTGIAPCYEMAKKYSVGNTVRFFFGGRSAGDVFDTGRYAELGEVNIATEDGSLGFKGFVTDILRNCGLDSERQVFINVGPVKMIESCVEIEKPEASEIWVSIEHRTSCGAGICGKCADSDGFITCVDGPFMRLQ
ncbi:MAG: tRNA-dihydrouridine synthase [Oscillospiraceae bacterium]|jgi:dihydroorotate dehydrogenase (NAD+) catalytic subunit|nr:tRNA-dihydrouridine synthase [Oscillospiraceae bacterium]